MHSGKITNEQIKDLKVSSLPTRPTSNYLYGGEGYSAEEMKAAFDRLPLYIIDAFNKLIEDIGRQGEDSIAATIPTGLAEGHTLYHLFKDIENGSFASYIKIGGIPLPTVLANLSERCGP